jgi:xanthine dehydrogenase accessory factor
MKTGSPKVVKVFLEEVEDSVAAVLKSQNEDEIHVETNCGGTMEIYIEPYLPQQRLIVIGQGGKDEVEDYMVKLGKMLEFEVIVIDHAPVLTEKPDKLIQDNDYDIASFDFSSADSVIVLTKGERDIETLLALSKFKLRYVGMMASRRRVKEDLEKLEKAGAKKEFLSSLKSPAGAEIGAVTASEIAMSIMSEVIASKYSREIIRKSSSLDTQSHKIER